jgi:hypothetical protein
MFIDCGTCAVRGAACADCVVTVLLGDPDRVDLADGVEVGQDERHAMAVLAQVGLVPRLRHPDAARRVS